MPKIRKRMLHVLKSEPDDLQKTLIYHLSRGYNCFQFSLFEVEGEEPDYDKLIDMIFDYDEVITWW